MNRFQDAWFKFSESDSHSVDARSEEQVKQVKEEQLINSDKEQEDDTTVKAASAITEGLFDHKLTKAEKKIAGPAVHYALGTGVGGLYGAGAEFIPEVTSGAGIPFGVAFG